jgi:hypothetical protein
MAPISRGFGGRRRDGIDPSRIPPGQYYERGFPVLSAGPTPRTPLEEWTFSTRSPSTRRARGRGASCGPGMGDERVAERAECQRDPAWRRRYPAACGVRAGARR